MAASRFSGGIDAGRLLSASYQFLFDNRCLGLPQLLRPIRSACYYALDDLPKRGMFDYREQFDHAPDYTGRGLTAISSRGKTGGWNEVNVGTIFEGSIKYVRTGHETKVDSCVELIAADGGAGYNFAIVSTTLAAGQPPNDAACREMAES